MPVIDTALIPELLQETGVAPLANKQEMMQHHLNREGATLGKIAEVISDVLHNAQYPNLKLQAAKLAAEYHGVTEKKAPEAESNRVVFVIQGENVQLNSLFKPERLK